MFHRAQYSARSPPCILLLGFTLLYHVYADDTKVYQSYTELSDEFLDRLPIEHLIMYVLLSSDAEHG